MDCNHYVQMTMSQVDPEYMDGLPTELQDQVRSTLAAAAEERQQHQQQQQQQQQLLSSSASSSSSSIENASAGASTSAQPVQAATAATDGTTADTRSVVDVLSGDVPSTSVRDATNTSSSISSSSGATDKDAAAVRQLFPSTFSQIDPEALGALSKELQDEVSTVDIQLIYVSIDCTLVTLVSALISSTSTC
jgi:hypothetical protein